MNRLPTWLVCLALAATALPSGAADYLKWEKRTVSADVTDWPLKKLLNEVARVSGWTIFIEPGTDEKITARFSDRTPADALQFLLRKNEFALIPGSGGAMRLLVFHSSKEKATERIVADRKRIPKELVVVAKPGFTGNVEELARQMGGRVTGKIGRSNAFRIAFDSEEATTSARNLLQNDSQLAVEDNFAVQRPDVQVNSAPSAPPFALNPKSTADGQNIIVGLVDTRVQIEGSVDPRFFLTPLSVFDSAGNGPGELTHGTSMAETLLRGVDAVQSDSDTRVRILPIDVYGNREETSTFDVAHGISLAIEHGANVINLSLGSDSSSSLLQTLIANGAKQNILFFASAGNEPTTAPTYPAAYPEVMAVTAGGRNGQVAPYANRGDFVDLIAPGTSLVFYKGQAFVVTGTSASSAYEAGAAAALLQAPGASPSKVQALLRSQMKFTPAPSK